MNFDRLICKPLWMSILLACLCPAPATFAGNTGYLSTGEAIGLGAGSLAVFKLGNVIKHANADIVPRWVKPPGFDESISRFLGRQPGLGKQNFLDSRFGSAITTISAGMAVLGTDMAYPRADRTKDVWQDQFIYYSGALATKGITDAVKGLVARQRPLCYCAPELAAQRDKPIQPEDHYSFFSGHTSSAFYSMTFLNKRLRAAMRQQMTVEEYRDYRWMSSAFSFGWATFVAFSRIQAYRHYLTDVVAGALVGYLIGELYYSLSDDVPQSGDGTASPLFIEIHLKF